MLFWRQWCTGTVHHCLQNGRGAPTETAQSSPAPRTRRWRLTSERRRFASNRRSTDPFDGRVGRRLRGTANAAANRARNRSNANSRFRSCERSSSATTRTTGPSAASSRARCTGPNDDDVETSNRTSTRVFERFACCPPGPPDAENRHSNSSKGITHDRVTRNPGWSATSPSLLL